MTERIHIRGAADVRRAMQALPKALDKRLLNDALMAGARVVRDEARDRVPLLKMPDPRRVRGALRRAIVAGRVRPERYAATVWVRVRPLTKAQIATFKKRQAKRGQKIAGAHNPNDPFYWRFVEFGTSKAAAQPFLRPAFEAKKEPAVQGAMRVLRDRVQAEIARLGQRYGGATR